MSDTTTARASIIVPITKGGAQVEIFTDDIPDDVYREIMLQGLKVLMNRGMSKITKASTKSTEEMKALAMAAAEKNLEAIKTSTIKFTGGKAKSKASGAVTTEARRLARIAVKAAMKEKGIKTSHVKASEITRIANILLEDDLSFVETAKANLEDRAKPVSVDIISTIQVDEKLVAKANEKKAKDQLSAKQAGKVQKRAKGQQAQGAMH